MKTLLSVLFLCSTWAWAEKNLCYQSGLYLTGLGAAIMSKGEAKEEAVLAGFFTSTPGIHSLGLGSSIEITAQSEQPSSIAVQQVQEQKRSTQTKTMESTPQALAKTPEPSPQIQAQIPANSTQIEVQTQATLQGTSTSTPLASVPEAQKQSDSELLEF